MTDEQHPFQPGVKVGLVKRYGFESIISMREVTVEKVHKTGRFIVSGIDAQWQARNTDDQGWSAFSRGWTGNIYLITEALCEEVAASNRRDEFVHIVRKLSPPSSRFGVSGRQLETMRALYAELVPEKSK